MTVLVDDRCGGGLFSWITAVASTVVVTNVAADDRPSNNRHNDGCRDDPNVVMVVAMDDCRSNDRRGG